MTSRKQALEELREKVSKGSTNWSAHKIKIAMGYHAQVHFVKAFHGSLDTAKAIHEAVLPEWEWRVYKNRFAGVEHYELGSWNGECEGNPARALLLADLSALIAQEVE